MSSEHAAVVAAHQEAHVDAPQRPPTASAVSTEKPARVIDPIDQYSAFIVRGAIITAGLAGVALFLRNSRIFAKFEHVNQIPKDFIRKELELKGKVREVLPNGQIRVEHQPIIGLPQIWPRRKLTDKPGLLKLSLAGLDISKAGQSFIAKDLRLAGKPVTFTVIKPTEDDAEAADADVTVKKNTFARTNLNVELVRRGYARVPPPQDNRHLKALQSIPAYSRLITRLLTSEKVADRRGVGVWERDTWVESVQSYPSQVGQVVRNAPITRAIVLLYNVTKDVILYGVKVAQSTYQGTLLVLAFLAAGYRRFAHGVDRLTKAYDSVKNRIK